MIGQVVGLFQRVGTGEIILILIAVVLLFGAKKLPELARAIGKSVRELRAGLKDDADDDAEGNAENETEGKAEPGED
jgi:sec-independent protein translocase protein TatA